MIIFNELRVTNDGQNLIIDVSVSSESWANNITIKSIKAETSDTYIEGGPSEHAVTIYKYTSQQGTKPKNVRRIRNINELDFQLTKNIIYVYVEWEGTPGSSIPCGMDTNPELGVTMHMGDIYNQTMSYIKELGNTCKVSQELIDNILRYKAVEASINSGHYVKANEYYNKFFKEAKQLNSSSNCGCYGY